MVLLFMNKSLLIIILATNALKKQDHLGFLDRMNVAPKLNNSF